MAAAVGSSLVFRACSSTSCAYFSGTDKHHLAVGPRPGWLSSPKGLGSVICPGGCPTGRLLRITPALKSQLELFRELAGPASYQLAEGSGWAFAFAHTAPGRGTFVIKGPA